VPDHLERLDGVERGVALPPGRVDGELVRVEAQRKLMNERLDAALPRREVVGDDQGTSHSACKFRAPLVSSESEAGAAMPLRKTATGSGENFEDFGYYRTVPSSSKIMKTLVVRNGYERYNAKKTSGSWSGQR